MRARAMLMAAVGALWITPAAARAVSYSWNINASGLFDTAANWSPAGPPGTSADVANFDQTGTYTVTFQTSRANNVVTVGNGNVKFALSGQTYSLTSLSIGDTDGQTGRMTLSNGTIISGFTNVGINPADTGFLTISTNSALTVNNNMLIGYQGTGTLTVQNGGDVISGGSSIGSVATAFGTATVSGAGSTWTNNGQFIIADGGTGSLSVTNGGVVTAASGLSPLIGNFAGSEGSLSVSGIGSRFSATPATLTVGNSGKGSVTVSAGGTVLAGWVTLANNAASSGTLTITGADATVTSLNVVTVGNLGSGIAEVTSGGVLTRLQRSGSMGSPFARTSF